jgi:hypothetical protein
MSIVENIGAAAPPGWLRWVVYPLSAAGLGLGIFVSVTGDPVAAAVLLVSPLAAVGLAASAPALFEIRQRGGGRGFSPLVGGGVLGAIIGALGPHVIGSLPMQLIGAGVGGVVGLGVAFATPGRPSLAGPIQYVAMLAVLGLAYCAAAVTVVDVRFDPGQTKLYQTTLTNKYESHGKSTSYYLQVPAWGPQTMQTNVGVPSRLYGAVQPGDPICMTLHPGALGAPWYTVAQCAAPAGGSGA